MKIYGSEKNRETIVCKWGCCGGVISKPRKGSAFSKLLRKRKEKALVDGKINNISKTKKRFLLTIL